MHMGRVALCIQGESGSDVKVMATLSDRCRLAAGVVDVDCHVSVQGDSVGLGLGV